MSNIINQFLSTYDTPFVGLVLIGSALLVVKLMISRIIKKKDERIAIFLAFDGVLIGISAYIISKIEEAHTKVDLAIGTALSILDTSNEYFGSFTSSTSIDTSSATEIRGAIYSLEHKKELLESNPTDLWSSVVAVIEDARWSPFGLIDAPSTNIVICTLLISAGAITITLLSKSNSKAAIILIGATATVVACGIVYNGLALISIFTLLGTTILTQRRGTQFRHSKIIQNN